MKQFKTLLIIAVIALSFNTINAQKVAHISTDQLISLMPETKVLNDELEKKSKTYEDELKSENDKLQATLQRYDAEAPSQTNEVNQQRMAEVQALQQNLQQASQVAREDLTKIRNEKLQPILEKAKNAIEEVATAGGYTYVLEASTLIVANGPDLLDQVKAKLGITE